MTTVHVFSNDFTSRSSTIVDLRIPKFQICLPFEPLLTHEQAEDNTTSVFLFGRFFCCLHNRRSDDIAVRSSDTIFLKLAGNHGLYLIFQSKSNLGDLLRRDSRGDLSFIPGENWVCVSDCGVWKW